MTAGEIESGARGARGARVEGDAGAPVGGHTHTHHLPQHLLYNRTWHNKKYIDNALEMMSYVPTNAGKHVTLNIACVCSQQYTKDSD